jgi:hypothetical protein
MQLERTTAARAAIVGAMGPFVVGCTGGPDRPSTAAASLVAASGAAESLATAPGGVVSPHAPAASMKHVATSNAPNVAVRPIAESLSGSRL